MTYNQNSDLSPVFVGRKIVSTSIPEGRWGNTVGTLTLDDGTVVTVYGNEGCGGCSNGYYSITSLSTCDNVITNVEVVDTILSDEGGWDEDHRYRIFVFTEHEVINAVQVDGTDGNGYYGTGFWIEVSDPSAKV